jgi:hypothetical protein
MGVLYAGCDLHGNSNLIGIVDAEGKRVFKKKLSNDPESCVKRCCINV